MSILLNNAPYDNAPWVQYLNEYLPHMDVWVYPDVPDIERVHYAAIWDHPHHDLERYPNLRAILNLGAGMDLIDRQPTLPKVPVVRLVDPEVGTDMAQFALYWTLHFQRNFEQYRALQQQQQWKRLDYINAAKYRVVVIGLGLIGAEIAQTLAANRFDVVGWNRSPKSVDQVKCIAGVENLASVLADARVIVNCLPLNAQTKHFFNSERLAQCREGASIINISRGAIIDDAELVDALSSGRINAAALDVFATEPLPKDSPYWRLPNAFVTPHMSGATYARSACRTLADNIARIEAGEQPFPLYSPPQHTA